MFEFCFVNSYGRERQIIKRRKCSAKIVDGSVVDVVVVDVKTETCDELKKGFKKGNSQFLFLYVVFSTANSKYVPEFFC